MRFRRALKVAATVLIGACCAVGLAWTVLNLSEVPHYGDTNAFLWRAKALEIDEYRGIVYPILLNLAGRVCLGSNLLDSNLPRHLNWEDAPYAPCRAPAGLACVQLFQIAVSAVCIGYFLFVVMPAASSRRRLVLLGALMLLDPLVNHFNMALMTDGLTLSFSLAFLAALVDLARRRSPTWLATGVLFATFVLAAGLRVEKKWVFLATIVVTVVVWSLLERRFPGTNYPRKTALAVGLAGLLGVNAVFALTFKAQVGWSTAEMLVHHRVIFPYLPEVYDQLPERAKALVKPRQAEAYGRSLNRYKRMIRRATAGRPELRDQLRDDLAITVLRERWPHIAAALVRDSVENTFATLSHYGRYTLRTLAGDDVFHIFFDADGTLWIHDRLRMHHPRTSHVYLWLSGTLLAAALLSYAFGIRRHARRNIQNLREDPDLAVLAVPMLAFVLLNAALFALVQDIVQIRYTLGSHALLIGLVYSHLLAGHERAGPCVEPS